VNLFPEDITVAASQLLETCRSQSLRIASAESCTGGLLAACVTSIAGSSDVFERGWATYSNQSKVELLGVSAQTLESYGAVSSQTALEMARGALQNSVADIAISITGIAGPGGYSAEKPVGLVHMATITREGLAAQKEFRFGMLGRNHIQLEAVRAALKMLARSASKFN
jgi:nicotinamide-nucleotide amidase